MRKIAWYLLVLLTFSIQWEYSLDLGKGVGNIARVAGLLLLSAATLAALQARRVRSLGLTQGMVLALYLWFCCSFFWSIDPSATVDKLRAFFQEMMIVWFVWELAETPEDLRTLMRAFVAGAFVLALLTLANYRSAEAVAAEQIRFVAEGQDPNDVARYLDLAFPFAALLSRSERRESLRAVFLGYLPVGMVAVLLTASRGGFVASSVSLAGCAWLLLRKRRGAMSRWVLALVGVAGALWLAVPSQTVARLATIPQQLEGGDFNHRFNIWSAGWQALRRAPFAGSGAGTFAAASRLHPQDTAHNSALSLAVTGGFVALFLASAIFFLAVRQAAATDGSLCIALITILAVGEITSTVATVEENRASWLLLGIIALAARLAAERPAELHAVFERALPDGSSQTGSEESRLPTAGFSGPTESPAG